MQRKLAGVLTLYDLGGFLKIGGSQKSQKNGWFYGGKSHLEMDDLGVPPFMETPIFIHILYEDFMCFGGVAPGA